MHKQNKPQLIELLKKTPIVSFACQKTGVSRATYYRWCKEDKKFKAAVEEAIQEGVMLMNDMSESQLLKAIREGNVTAIFYWLNHRHPAYRTWLEKQVQYFKKYKKKTGKKEYVSGESFLYLGRQYKLLIKTGKSPEVRLEKGKITVFTKQISQDRTANRKLLDKWFEERTKSVLESRFKEMMKRFNYDFVPHLTTRKMPKRWGSYLSCKKIILNPLLIRASKDCIDYVIVHELCHMKHKNHDKNFFKLQESITPNWKKIKEKLELRFL